MKKTAIAFSVLASLSLSSLAPSYASARVVGRLMQLAASHEGHRSLEQHPFMDALRKGDFSREQLAQFLQDKIYILQLLERNLDRNEMSQLSPEERIFYRSFSYQEDLKSLLGQSEPIQPSDSAVAYGDYLTRSNSEVAALHFWLILMGETFGAQHISGYISQKFPTVGDAAKNFEDLKLISVRGHINRWADEQLDGSSIEFKEEIGKGFEHFSSMFDAAYQVPSPSEGYSTLLARKWNEWFGSNK